MAGAMRSTGQAAPKPAAKSDPAVLKQQQDLIAKGAKIKADGIMGPATQAAIKQFAAAPAASRSTAPAAGGGRGFVNPTAPVKKATAESREINRMRFLAGLIKD
jgi:peptidoglycan hydrolase-like protein with peptidoglycan-binding domain